MTKKKLFSAAIYRQRTTEADVTLPSGAEFRLKKIGLAKYSEQGRLPNFIVKAAKSPVSAADALEPENLQELLQFMTAVAIDACIEPKLKRGATADDEEHLDPNELDQADLMFIVNFALGQNFFPTKAN